jgi:uncharacterized protein YhfF
LRSARAEQRKRLADLVAGGIKRATTSVLAAYEDENEPLPTAGDHAVVIDGFGNDICINRTTRVEIRAYAEIVEAHASSEGEGDRTLLSWRVEHDPLLRDICGMLDIVFGGDLELVLEAFEVVDQRASGAKRP